MKKNKCIIWISIYFLLTLFGTGCGKQVDNLEAEALEELRHFIVTIDLQEDCAGFEKGNYASLCSSSEAGRCVKGFLTVHDGIISVDDLIYEETFDGEITLSKDATGMITGTSHTNDIDFSYFTVGRSSIGTHHWDSKPGAPCDIRVITR